MSFRLTTFLTAALAAAVSSALEPPPNFVVVFCDDLGYGDLGCFGHPTIATPQLDRMAAEGMRLTSFYCAAPVCTPSRAALMTGRLPARSGMCSDKRRVLFPDSQGGLPAGEVTLAEALDEAGYVSACVGKWHLGHLPPFLPTAHGFDSYFGIPYSNDMDRVASAPRGREAFWDPKVEYWNVPLMRDLRIVERPADQRTITRRYTEAATAFIRENRQRPFLLYLPHSMPHVPLFRSEKFAGRSRRGLYGDVIEEIDWSVGQVLDTLRELQIDSRTLVVFTSDNGPWLPFETHGGSAGLLRGGKGSTWEGGMRVPGIAWWPGRIPAGSACRDMACTMDLLPTMCKLAGAEAPAATLDGRDISAALTDAAATGREAYFYYRGYRLFAARVGPYKAHFQTQSGYGQRQPEQHDPPLLFHLEHDPGERYNVADEHPEVLQQIAEIVARHREGMRPAPSQLELR